MNYRHAYHAGNAADVFKHIVLTALLQHLLRKESSFFVLETHAGIGLYNLASVEAQKTGEYLQGIARLWGLQSRSPLLESYLGHVANFNAGGRLQVYPGSPAIICDNLRRQDSAAFCELHDDDAKVLKTALKSIGTIAVHHRDAYEALGALLPPAAARGLVLIDPPFEQPDELSRLAQAIDTHYRKFARGMWAIWYPIKDRALVWQFETEMVATNIRRQMVFEFTTNSESDSRTLNGSAVLVVNPPFEIENTLLPALQEAHCQMTGHGKVVSKWLVPE